MNFLSLFVLIPLLMLLGLWLSRNIAQIRAVMVTGASALLVLSAALTVMYLNARHAGATDEMLFRADMAWYPALNIHYSVGVDGISVAMLLLSAIIVFTGTFASWRLQPLTKEYFLWFTFLSIGVFGFFISIDLFTMFMFYEVALIPMYLLIGVWGSGRKEYSAMKLTLMLMGGSAFLLIGILGIYYGAGATSMNLLEIAQMHNIPIEQQRIWFPLTFLGFGVLGALFPFHTWSPDGHASAPTAVSMLHAGVLMKLGGYGCFRIAMYLMPEAAQELGWIFLILTGISVVYGAFSACVQTDLKYINAYSSVSHCGLVLFAILMMNQTACTGHFYVQVTDYLSEVTKALIHITRPAFEHIDNNHKGLSKEQIVDLMRVNDEVEAIFDKINDMLSSENFADLDLVLEMRDRLFDTIVGAIKNQLRRIHEDPSGSTRASVLYLTILNETKTMVLQARNLLKSQRYFLDVAGQK